MIAASGASLVVLLFLLIAEEMREKRKIAGESARKFVHITVGVFVASWPFYLSYFTIQVLCVAFLAAVMISRHFNVFPAIHNIYRKSWGEVLFPVGIALTAFLAYSPWIFAAAILHLGLADGLAAVVGEGYKKARAYTVFGQKKSVAGTLVFWVTSMAITAWLTWASPLELGHLALPLIIGLPFVASLVENISPNGTDNVFVPVVVCAILNLLTLVH